MISRVRVKNGGLFKTVHKNQFKSAMQLCVFGKSLRKNGSFKMAVRIVFFVLIVVLELVPSKGSAQFREPAATNRGSLKAFPRDFLPGCTGDKWIANDKYRHFMGSAFAAAFGYLAMRYYLGQSRNEAVLFGGGFSFSLGIGKELRDKYFHAGCASWKDLTADLLGMTFGLIFYTETIRWQ